MTREEFIKKRWVGYELIEFRPPKKEDIVYECMLLAIDFEQDLFKLEPVDKEMYEDESFWARVEYCKRPAPKLKVKN
jgi:hypothetical protein